MKTKFFIALLYISNLSYSQWATSPYTDSALFVCPGFIPNILILEDGSSYIAGGLSDYIFVQKLDPEGYILWSQPVEVFHTPGTENYDYTMVSDGQGGLIFIWKDYRGAFYSGDPASPRNNALFMQRIDENGNAVWQTNGIQLAPVDGGYKEASIVNDGNGGAIVMLGENDFQRPESPDKEWIWLQHYNKDGTKIWEMLIDSSSSSNKVYPPGSLVRLGSITRFGTSSGVKFIDNNGNFIDTLNYKPKGGIYVVTDSSAFEVYSLPEKFDSLGNRIFVAKIIRITSKWDSLWSTEFEIPDEADENRGYLFIKNPYVSDGNDGLFFLWSFIDKSGQKRARLQHITPQGASWSNYGLDFNGNYGFAIFSGDNEAGIFFDNGTAQKFDIDGQPIWPDSMFVLANPSDAHFQVFAPDLNGGLIVSFWTTFGGIFAQHTGRNGKLGVVTDIKDIANSIPMGFELFQNYPNPFNPTTTIKFLIKEQSNVKISITNILGQNIIDLINKEMNSGTYEIQWNAGNHSSGVYFYSFFINNKLVSTRKLLLTK